jgi:hypothetical protein
LGLILCQSQTDEHILKVGDIVEQAKLKNLRLLKEVMDGINGI